MKRVVYISALLATLCNIILAWLPGSPLLMSIGTAWGAARLQRSIYERERREPSVLERSAYQLMTATLAALTSALCGSIAWVYLLDKLNISDWRKVEGLASFLLSSDFRILLFGLCFLLAWLFAYLGSTWVFAQKIPKQLSLDQYLAAFSSTELEEYYNL